MTPSYDQFSLVMCLLNIALIYLRFYFDDTVAKHHKEVSGDSQSARIHFGRVDLNVIDPGHSSDHLL